MLKYLFDVEFTDGTTYTQNAEDKSILTPPEEKRSCFTDVLKLLEGGKKIKTFMISDGQDAYSVDCIDGHFEVNDRPFFMHEERTWQDFRICYFRQHTHNFLMGMDKLPEEVSHQIVFRLGWQILDDQGRNHQRIMEID